jgi:hypothetical protein
MELHEFVRETLVQIIRGVLDAQGDAAIAGGSAAIVPVTPGVSRVNSSVYQDVTFSLAVTAASGTATKGGIMVVAGVLGLGSHGESRAQQEASSRVSFAIPVRLPTQSAHDRAPVSADET